MRIMGLYRIKKNSINIRYLISGLALRKCYFFTSITRKKLKSH